MRILLSLILLAGTAFAQAVPQWIAVGKEGATFTAARGCAMAPRPASMPQQWAADNLSTVTAAYNADALADANLIAGDGGDVVFVNVRAYLCPDCANVPPGTGDMNDAEHPNDLGHAELATAFEAAIDIIRGLAGNKHILGNAGLIGNFR